MSELAALSMIGGYCGLLFLLGMVAIKVEEKRKIVRERRKINLQAPAEYSFANFRDLLKAPGRKK